ncbi:MAG: 4Fe-4S binding protein [Acidimicrobiia bacterium]|nr:4Fe-4S binding protein [Acidimicrobiia bacterium]
MSLSVLEICLGCGACETVCPTGAISQSDNFRVAYVVDPLLCNDCRDCIPVCPVDAFEEDPEWAVCDGRGCPLTSARLEGWLCTQGQGRCPTCGTMLWSAPTVDGWRCPRCDDGMRVMCPKTRKLETTG